MIKAAFVVTATVAFALGCYVGWKTTMHVLDQVTLRATATKA